MKQTQDGISRREMLRWTGLAGLAGAMLPGVAMGVEGENAAAPAAAADLPQVPRRVLGKTGQKIPILLMGGAMNFDRNFDPKFAECMRFGVNYFDMADCYSGGTSEIAMGGFLERSTQRDALWITTKSCNHEPEGMVKLLEQSLTRMKTDHVDLFFLHGLKDPAKLSTEMGKMSEQLKKDGKIRYFGFSCHDSTVAELLNKAAGLSYIDAIMFKYNFREYGNKELNDAMDACHKANVGLIAMKTQGSAVSFEDRIKKLDGSEFSRHQAVLKAVWEDERLSAAVSAMDTLEKIKENVAASLNKAKLSAADWKALDIYANATRHTYCSGCQHICGRAVPAGIEVGTTLRYLMYHDGYRDPETARELFAQLPEAARRIEGVDFSGAAALCPNGIDIAKYMQRAARVLA